MTDFSNPNCRIDCRSVSHRSSVIEVGVIGPGQIDLEVFEIDPDKHPAGKDIRSGGVTEDSVTAMTETVLTEAEAQRLIDLLGAAIDEARLLRQSGAAIGAEEGGA
ncbi:hypothetical protein [Methylocapsa sp. S129]|uniref:hypothetical protein n=1 Tax=Methylocapsa sp. S129 TaxID=1641869 RepID=UPI00131D9475|nr:hypothetical protein [Methylocapsa sp. S129]